jgi:two-component system sensor histidine kinase QseC
MKLLRRLDSLQGRLLALLLLLVSGVWFAAAVLTWVNTRHELGELLDAHLAQSAAILIAQQGEVGDADEPAQRHHPHRRHLDEGRHPDAPILHKYATQVAFQVFHQGRLTLHSSTAPEAPMSSQTRGFATVQLPGGDSWRVFGAQGNEGDVQVFVGEQLQSRRSILWSVMQSVLAPLLVALPVLGLLGWLAVRQSLKPLRSLSQAVAGRTPQATEPLVIHDTPAEMAPVVQSLNALFERIRQMLEAERRFTADAAHELRTPMAAIRAQAQVALGASDDPQQRQQALLNTLQGCDRATHLIAQLLTLSRLEAAGQQAPAAVVNLSAVAQRVAAELAPLALGRGQSLTLAAPQPCLIWADEALIGVLLRNLIDNALRYSPDSACVNIHVESAHQQALLHVEDSGPGLTEADLARLGERFFRGLGHTQSGSGLGWSIVRRIAEVYHAQVQAHPSKLGGLRVSVAWPLAANQGSPQI